MAMEGWRHIRLLSQVSSTRNLVKSTLIRLITSAMRCMLLPDVAFMNRFAAHPLKGNKFRE